MWLVKFYTILFLTWGTWKIVFHLFVLPSVTPVGDKTYLGVPGRRPLPLGDDCFHLKQNRSIELGPVPWHGVMAEGNVKWPGIRSRAGFAVLPSLVSPEEVAAIRAALPNSSSSNPHSDAAAAAALQWDQDPDSVDSMATFEFYLEKNGSFGASLATIPGKPDADPRVRAARRPAREALAAVTRRVFRERLTPFVNKRFKKQCRGRCRPCFSLVRRYVDGERRTHV